MAIRRIGVIMHGATGNLSRAQHVTSLTAIRAEGGLRLPSGDIVMPDPLFVGRDADRLARLARETGHDRWSTDLDAALADPEETVFFDAANTAGRFDVVKRAIAAGKHIYCEKPVATTVEDAMELYRLAEAAGIRHGTVQDKMSLPGFQSLLTVLKSGFLGRILEARLEMGRWVFDGTVQPGQRASWNYRKDGGGGLVLDMFPHWRYMLEQLVGDPVAISCRCMTQISERIDERGVPYNVDVDDSVFAHVAFANNAVASLNCSWATRPRQEASILIQIDGTNGSAYAGPRECFTMAAANTPRGGGAMETLPPDQSYANWHRVPQNAAVRSGYRVGWERFLQHVVEGTTPYPHSLLAGARGVQFASLAYQSHREGRWVDIPALA